MGFTAIEGLSDSDTGVYRLQAEDWQCLIDLERFLTIQKILQ